MGPSVAALGVCPAGTSDCQPHSHCVGQHLCDTFSRSLLHPCFPLCWPRHMWIPDVALHCVVALVHGAPAVPGGCGCTFTGSDRLSRVLDAQDLPGYWVQREPLVGAQAPAHFFLILFPP